MKEVEQCTFAPILGDGCQTFRTLTLSYPAFRKRVKVRHLGLALGLVLVLGQD